MKKNFKIRSKEVFVLLTILIIFIIFGIKTYTIKKYEDEKNSKNKEYSSIISKKQNEIEFVKDEIQENAKDMKGSYKNPYIPNGFHHIEGTSNDGYVIRDNAGNEFVWVPCRVYANDDVIELKRYNFDISDNLFIDKCFENIDNVKEFIQSVGKYEGFYIARYEAGKENGKIVSKKDVEVYSNVTYQEAFNLSKNMYKDNDEISSELINSLAWDTTLKWIDKTTNSKFSTKGSYTSSYNNVIQKTGYDAINRIYDLSGNVFEWTTEKSYELPVYRGGYYASNKDIKRAPGYRMITANDTKYNNIGYRVVIYAK